MYIFLDENIFLDEEIWTYGLVASHKWLSQAQFVGLWYCSLG